MTIAPYIREIGRGKDGARSLGRDAAFDLMSQVLDGRVSDLELGAFALAMRIKGESAAELDGFLAAAQARSWVLVPPAPAVVLPSYNGARKLPNLTPLLALALARRGVPVLVHGGALDPGRVTTAEVFAELGVDVCGDAAAVADAWVRGEPAFVATETICPPLATLLAVRRVVGLRNSGHTVAKLLDPCRPGTALRVVNYTHPEYALLLAEFIAGAGIDALLMRGTEGEPVANARRLQKLDVFLGGRAQPRLSAPAQEGVLGEIAALPAIDAAATAAYMRAVLAGDAPMPAPIARQTDVLLATLAELRHVGRAALAVASHFDVFVVGAGAAGLYCAGIAGQRGARVLVVDHFARVAEKIRISGGGRCNFTNVDVAPAHFLSANPHFCRSALARCTPRDFVALVERHGIGWHEKHKGQLFCDDASERIVAMLLAECGEGGVERWQPCSVDAVERTGAGFALATSRGAVEAARLVVASGGLSIPKIGASDFGYALARRFGHAVVETRPGLVPFMCTDPAWAPFAELAGLAVPVRIGADTGDDGGAAVAFDEDLLFTHRGLSGPAALQISSYWSPGRALTIDLAPGRDVRGALLAAKRAGRRDGAAVLAELLPRRLAQTWAASRPALDRPLSDWRDRDIAALADGLHAWPALPAGTEGYRKAEVTAGGVDTRELDSRTMESRRVAGLYFVGEVVDVTGWLGGYNFQWAWASGAACAHALTPG